MAGAFSPSQAGLTTNPIDQQDNRHKKEILRKSVGLKKNIERINERYVGVEIMLFFRVGISQQRTALLAEYLSPLRGLLVKLTGLKPMMRLIYNALSGLWFQLYYAR